MSSSASASASASSSSSYTFCKVFGKDTVYFATKEDHSVPSTVVLPPPEPSQGLITKEGEINWSCPCLGGMATGPCGVQFRDAFSCFHYSEADPKGSDCYEAFRTMQDCFSLYPTVYNKNSNLDDDDMEQPGMEGGNLNNLEQLPATSTELDKKVPETKLTETTNK